MVRLTPNTLQLELSVRNDDTRAMPSGLGFHPFFPLTPETHLQSDWKGMWKMSADSLPTELGPVPPEADFSHLPATLYERHRRYRPPAIPLANGIAKP